MPTSVTIRKATTEDAELIQALAEETWWPTYTPILTKDQIRYMLDTIYSTETLRKAIENNTQEFIILEEKDRPVGFASFSERPEEKGVYKLHKIYVLPSTQGKGFGVALMDEVKRILHDRACHVLDLNVNRYNKARTFYEKLGFNVIREEDIPIGPYWMNDFVMRLEFENTI